MKFRDKKPMKHNKDWQNTFLLQSFSENFTGENQYFVGNKAKGRIWKRVFQENKARQILRKTNISYPQIRTRTCAYQGVRNVRYSENLTCFVFLKHPFWDSPFCLITNVFTHNINYRKFWAKCDVLMAIKTQNTQYVHKCTKFDLNTLY